MMVFSPLDQERYEKGMKEASYCKLFPYILEDFITRKDAEQMMSTKNYIITVKSGIPVATTGSSSAQSGATVTSGLADLVAIYKGQTANAESITLKNQREIEKESGMALAKSAIIG